MTRFSHPLAGRIKASQVCSSFCRRDRPQSWSVQSSLWPVECSPSEAACQYRSTCGQGNNFIASWQRRRWSYSESASHAPARWSHSFPARTEALYSARAAQAFSSTCPVPFLLLEVVGFPFSSPLWPLCWRWEVGRLCIKLIFLPTLRRCGPGSQWLDQRFSGSSACSCSLLLSYVCVNFLLGRRMRLRHRVLRDRRWGFSQSRLRTWGEAYRRFPIASIAATLESSNWYPPCSLQPANSQNCA